VKNIDEIPTGKLNRSSKIVKTGAKIGMNYLKYYGKKTFNPDIDHDELNTANASDIYDSFKNLKGSTLKMAQMLSLQKNLMPGAYVEKFSLAQFNVPPLSIPLVRKTFKKYQGVYPEDFYDEFTPNAVSAASIGQVHRAKKDGMDLAVKIQYPGVAESVSSDLALVKPMASKIFNLQGRDKEKFFDEIEEKLLEETDYIHEVTQSKYISNACEGIPKLKFPNYYENLSSDRIITMDWMNGSPLGDFVKTDFLQETGNAIGQRLWDFYMLQIHKLKTVNADPHPGNFMIDENENLIAIDFGCVKTVPAEFYQLNFELIEPENLNNLDFFKNALLKLDLIHPEDTEEEKDYFTELFHEMMSTFAQPFHHQKFDFNDEEFWNKITGLSGSYKDKEIRKMNANRGSRHFLYITRTFFGLYNLLHDLKAKVDTENYKKYL
jgi:predicted unusual protein kinase regulating ubiquinone biosynthesis (AarF/ABC1/UbiB family)